MKWHLKGLLSAAILFMAWSSIQAQVLGTEFFNDNEEISGFDLVFHSAAVEDGIIMSGLKKYDGWDEVFLIKVDFEGNTIWSSSSFKQIRMEETVWEFPFILDENHAYAACNYDYSTGRKVEFWKIDLETGEFIWRNPYDVMTQSRLDTFIDEDENTFLWIYRESNQIKVDRFAKSDGSLFQSYVLQDFNFFVNDILFRTDRLGNIYAVSQAKLTKYRAPDFQEILWTYTVSSGFTPRIEMVYSDRTNQLFVFENGKVHKVNPWTGERIWLNAESIYNGNVRDEEIIDTGDELIFSKRHATTGSGSRPFQVARMNKSSGSYIFDVEHSMIGPYGSLSGNKSGVLSLARDCNDDVYFTGYYADANFGPDNWGMMKLNGQDGSKLYEETFTAFPEAEDNLSQGEFIHLEEDVPLLIGERQINAVNSSDTRVSFASIDTSSNTVGDFFEIDAAYRYSSSVQRIEKNDDNVYLLKEVGRNYVLEQRNTSGDINWELEFQSETKLFQGFIAPHEDGVLLNYRISEALTDTLPYFLEETQKMYMAYFSLDGQLVEDTLITGFSISVDQKPLHSLKDGSTVYLGITSGLILKWSYEQNQLNYIYPGDFGQLGENGRELMIDLDENSLLFFGSNGVILVNKNNLSASYNILWSQRFSRDIIQLGDTVYYAGHLANNTQLLTAYRISTNTKLWERSYTNPGSWHFIEAGENNLLYAVGISNDQFRISSLNQSNGLAQSNFYLDNPLLETILPTDAKVINGHYFAISAINERSDGSSEPVFLIYDMQELEMVNLWIGESSSYRKSGTYAVEIVDENQAWYGGSWFHDNEPYSGFLTKYLLELNDDNSICPGDLNNDGVVNTADLSFILVEQGCMFNCQSDLNGNGISDMGDLLLWLSFGFGICE